MEVLDKSPIDIPSSVSKNLSPEYPLNTGWVDACPREREDNPASSSIVKARDDFNLVWNLSPATTIFDVNPLGCNS